RNEIRDAVEAERVLRVIPKIGQTCPEPRTFSPSFFVSFLSPEKEMKGGRDVRKKCRITATEKGSIGESPQYINK
ncbi:MAG: hypothetical protein IJ069_12470, partial [Prevotella sp.]|nr:hypothetical protein [Prevotella sp.]